MSNDDGTVFVGNKPITSYVMAVVTQFNQNNTDTVTIKARGRAISRAVDVAEVVTKRFMKQTTIESIKSDTEQITTREGHASNVSSIAIVIQKT